MKYLLCIFKAVLICFIGMVCIPSKLVTWSTFEASNIDPLLKKTSVQPHYMDIPEIEFNDIELNFNNNPTVINSIRKQNTDNNQTILDGTVGTDFTEEVIRTIIITGCGMIAGYAFSFYMPVIAFQLGYQGSLLLSQLLFPSPTSLAYHSIVLPRAIHAGCFCYSSPIVSTVITATSSAAGAMIGKGITDLFYGIQENYFEDVQDEPNNEWVYVPRPHYFKPSIRIHRWRVVRWIGKKIHFHQMKQVLSDVY